MLELSYQNILTDGIGDKGFEFKIFEKATTIKKIKNQMEKDAKAGLLDYWDIYSEDLDLSNYMFYVDSWRDMESIVVVSTGDIILGIQSLQKAFTHPFYNYDQKFRKNGKRMFYLDNIDPDNAIGLLEGLDLETTGFIIIAPDGDELEPLALLGIIREKIGAENLHGHVLFITNPEEGVLQELALNDGYTLFAAPKNIPTRFMVLSSITFLPLIFAGIDIKKIYTGAKRAARAYKQINFQNPVILLTSIFVEFYKQRDIRDVLFFPFQERLSGVGEWLSYYWNQTMNRDKQGFFSSFSHGTSGNHILMQGILEGVQNKLIIFPNTKKFQRRAVLRNFFESNRDLKYLKDKDLGDINITQEGAAIGILKDKEIPNIQISHADLMEEGIAETIVFFQYTTLFLSYMMDFDFHNDKAWVKGQELIYGQTGRPSYKAYKTTYANLVTVFEKYKLRK